LFLYEGDVIFNRKVQKLSLQEKKPPTMKKVLLTGILACCLLMGNSQNVGIGTASPHTSAKLHIEDANRGLLVPRVALVNVSNSASPVNVPATGLLVWNTNAAVVGGAGIGFYYWDGAQWVTMRGAGDHDWYEVGTTTAADNINDNIYTLGRVAIGLNIPNPSAQLHVNGNIMVNNDQRLILDGFFYDNWLYHDSGLNELRLESPSETVHVTGDVARISTGTESIYLSGGLSGGSIGVNTLIPTSTLDINGIAGQGYRQLRLRQSFTPTNTADVRGNVGDLSWDNNFFYVKTAVGWKRAALSVF
jgi:hypothetical protein